MAGALHVRGRRWFIARQTRPPGIPPIADHRVREVVALTLTPPPHEATHWTLRAMASAVGVAASTVQTIWKALGLVPHRFRQFKLSNDCQFVEKLHDIVGLYVSPPAHAIALSIDETSQIPDPAGIAAEAGTLLDDDP